MSEAVAQIIAQLGRLTLQERAAQARAVLLSLEPEGPGAEAAWDEELARRAARIRNGSGLRENVPRRFPYTTFFLKQEDRIWIAAVAHQRQRPGYWSQQQPE